ncbi:MAG: cold shock domain-containing protein [Rhodobacteraceae bacterium]|nr:cold shock domain-containing protein [Paracoccaceae bacterium]MCP5341884.1 cold shock domain-containing protein [Paracoccaceae bacterium]
MSNQELDQHKVLGRVKWFDPAKGFGFIVTDENGGDILLHANVLRNFGQSSVSDNAIISVMVQKTARGAQAVEVLEIQAPEGEDFSHIEDMGDGDGEAIAALPLEPARIKWFDKVKGFGFANVYSREEDVFVHIEVLRRSGFADLQAGEAVCLRVVDGKRGRMAVQVASWEAALRTKP